MITKTDEGYRIGGSYNFDGGRGVFTVRMSGGHGMTTIVGRIYGEKGDWRAIPDRFARGGGNTVNRVTGDLYTDIIDEVFTTKQKAAEAVRAEAERRLNEAMA